MTQPAAIDASALAEHYTRFRVSERLLLTGHSHQAWPDVAFEAQQRAWLDDLNVLLEGLLTQTRGTSSTSFFPSWRHSKQRIGS